MDIVSRRFHNYLCFIYHPGYCDILQVAQFSRKQVTTRSRTGTGIPAGRVRVGQDFCYGSGTGTGTELWPWVRVGQQILVPADPQPKALTYNTNRSNDNKASAGEKFSTYYIKLHTPGNMYQLTRKSSSTLSTGRLRLTVTCLHLDSLLSLIVHPPCFDWCGTCSCYFSV